MNYNTNVHTAILAKCLLFCLAAGIFLSGCGTCYMERYEGLNYDPIYMDIDSLESLVEVLPPREFTRAGGLYYKDGFVYVLELGAQEDPWANADLWDVPAGGQVMYNISFEEVGIHVIDDRDPSNPIPVAFIRVPGANGMAAKGNQLYTDAYTDLLVFDISDPTRPVLENRVQGVYDNLGSHGIPFDLEKGAVIGYNVEMTTYEYEVCEGIFAAEDEVAIATVESFSQSTGVAGSMARFVTVGDHLYTIDYSDLHLFDVSGSTPEKISDIHIGWEIETIYPHEDKLFFGAFDGMYIYDNSDPSSPRFLSKYEHVTSCDPVVVQGQYAYVTLRSGSACQGFTNQLDVVDISDPINPVLAQTHQMDNPHGLAINGNCLFICEGDYGFKTFGIDPVDRTQISQTGQVESIHAYDVIALPNMLMVVGDDGFYQYSQSCGTQLEYLGVISF